MGSANKTPHFNLSQFGDNDKPTWRGDYTNDMSIIDTEMNSLLDGIHNSVSIPNYNSDMTVINGEITSLQTAVNNALPPILGPRNIPRIKSTLKPVLAVDSMYPNDSADITHKLLSVIDSEWWSYGHDCTLRKSVNEGRTWSRIYSALTTGQMGRDGIWIKTTAGSYITTWHPFDGSDPWIMRSTNGGVSWTTVVNATPNIKYLGTNSLCQSPTTNKIYLAEYVTTDAVSTINIKVSSDDGATWSVWKSLPRNTSPDPSNTTGITHVHSIQIDPITNRLWVAVGDAPPSAGLYQMLSDESDWTAIATNRMLNTASGIWGGAVGIAFFPNYIAWGVDQSYTSGLVRMARSEIGKPTPVVSKVMDFNSSGFYTCRTKTDNSEWLVSASQEGPDGQRIDANIHMYRVADDALTCDEVASFPVNTSGPAFSYTYPLGSPLQANYNGLTWWGCNIYGGQGNEADTGITGFQFSARLGWGGLVIPRPSAARKYRAPMSQSSGRVSVNGSGYTDWGSVVSPNRPSYLYIIEAGVKNFIAGGIQAFEIWTVSPFAIATLENGNNASFNGISLRRDQQANTDSYIYRIINVPANTELSFRLHNTGTTADAMAHITYAWGF